MTNKKKSTWKKIPDNKIQLSHAWAVFTCKAEAFKWPEGQ